MVEHGIRAIDMGSRLNIDTGQELLKLRSGGQALHNHNVCLDLLSSSAQRWSLAGLVPEYQSNLALDSSRKIPSPSRDNHCLRRLAVLSMMSNPTRKTQRPAHLHLKAADSRLS